MYRNIACYKNVWRSRIFIRFIFASNKDSNLTLNLTYYVMCKTIDNCESNQLLYMLDRVKLNVHQLNMDHLYLELLTPCINTKNKKSKKEVTLSLLYHPPLLLPQKKLKKFKAPYHLCYKKQPKESK